MDQGPIASAEIDLMSLKDEHCVQTYNAITKNIEKTNRVLQKCMQNVASTQPDKEGHYHFPNLAPGWYVIDFLWNTNNPENSLVHLFKVGDWGVVHFGWKDKTGKYDTMAQGYAFYFSGKEDAVKDFVNQKSAKGWLCFDISAAQPKCVAE